jgi:hypothetical protein
VKPRRPGRPRLDPSGPSIGVHLRVTPQVYAAWRTRAAEAHCRVSTLMRRAILSYLRTGDGPGDDDREG